MAYAVHGDVTARIPGRTLGTGSSPSTSTITDWLAEAEAEVDGILASRGVSTPITASGGIKILKKVICEYAEARTRMALAAGAGDGSNDDGESAMGRYEKALERLETDPGVEAMLIGSSSGSSSYLRGYVTDNTDGKSVASGDFDPVFERDEVF